LKDRRAHLKHVFSVKRRTPEASHVPLKKSEKPACPHQCEAGLQLATENLTHQILVCNSCHVMIKIEKRGENCELG